jgi:hypothetical protein
MSRTVLLSGNFLQATVFDRLGTDYQQHLFFTKHSATGWDSAPGRSGRCKDKTISGSARQPCDFTLKYA